MTSTRATAEPDARFAARDLRWLTFVCFLSGAAGLIFEMVWFHRSGLVFGSSVWATSLVLSSFMGGLAIGSAIIAHRGHRVRRFLRTYAALEVTVALSGVAVTHALPGLTHAIVILTSPVAESLWVINVVRFGAAFTILLVPSTAMGATLPLLVAALARWRTGFGSALGRLYGWNTLGAVAGVVGAEVWLVGRFGVAGSAWFAALLGVSAATCALRLSGRTGETDAEHLAVPAAVRTALRSRPGGPPRHRRRWSLLVCSFLSGGTLLALEVVWFRFLTMYVLSTTLAASLMLAVVLAAIGLGGLSAAAWLRRSPTAATRLPVVAFAAGCAVVASYAAFDLLTAGTRRSRPGLASCGSRAP